MNRKIIFLLLIALVIITTIFIGSYSKIVAPARSTPLHIIEHVHFKSLWVNEDTFIGGNIFLSPSGFIQIENDFLLSLTVQPQLFRQNWVLRKQKLQTGESVWEIDFGSEVIKGVINNTASVFVISSIQRVCGNVWKPNCEAIRVTAYDLNSSNEKWSQVYNGMLNISWMELDKEIIELHGSANRGNHRATFRIDAKTGEMIWSGSPTLSLQEIREKVKQRSQYFVPKEITTPVISNVAECGTIAYFATTNGVLFAVDQDSRSIIGRVDFSPKEHDINIFDVHVLCDNFFVVVYFEASLQIFTFRFSQDGNG
jgi:outer membrane protein assembly factor BamB